MRLMFILSRKCMREGKGCMDRAWEVVVVYLANQSPIVASGRRADRFGRPGVGPGGGIASAEDFPKNPAKITTTRLPGVHACKKGNKCGSHKCLRRKIRSIYLDDFSVTLIFRDPGFLIPSVVDHRKVVGIRASRTSLAKNRASRFLRSIIH